MKNLKKLSLLILMLGWGVSVARAQESDLFKLQFETRVDYQHEGLDGQKVDGASGFKGKYLTFQVDGRISPKFSYSYRQRLNKAHADQSFFDATDWVWLDFRMTKNWSFNAGKQVLLIGGFEYDRSPLDVYQGSEFWNNIGCYQLGASVTYHSNNGLDKITFQACQSPFDTPESDLYAFNLFWTGSHGCYTTLHSLNAMQCAPGEYVYYVTLGNQFTWGDLRLQLDLMERTTDFSKSSFSVMADLSYLFIDRINLFAKYTYDNCEAGLPPMAEIMVLPGTEISSVGGGIEYFPLGGKGDRSVRLHAAYFHNMGTNTNPAGTLLDKRNYFSMGVTWRFDVIQVAKKLFTNHE